MRAPTASIIAGAVLLLAGILLLLDALRVLETALPPAMDGSPAAAVLFLGLAACFASVALTRDRMKWPWIPAAALAFLGLSFAVQSAVTFCTMEYR